MSYNETREKIKNLFRGNEELLSIICYGNPIAPASIWKNCLPTLLSELEKEGAKASYTMATLLVECKRLCDMGQRIPAIKLVRNYLDSSLSDAKALIDSHFPTLNTPWQNR